MDTNTNTVGVIARTPEIEVFSSPAIRVCSFPTPKHDWSFEAFDLPFGLVQYGQSDTTILVGAHVVSVPFPAVGVVATFFALVLTVGLFGLMRRRRA
jgi:hypothetical protein